MWFILLLILSTLFYYFATKNFNYWQKLGVPGPKPTFFVGNIGKSLIGLKSLTDILDDIYKKFDGCAFVGIYRMGTPCLLIRDMDFVKTILVKDFKSFHDNDVDIDKNVERIIGRNPFFLKGAEWKPKRALLTSCFTSGKMKGTFPILEEVSQRMVKYIENEIERQNSLFETRDVCVRYTLDNVAACAFGLEGKNFESDHSEFRDLADKFLSPSTLTTIKIVIVTVFPLLSKFLKIRFVSKEVDEKLMNIVSTIIKHRSEHNIVRNDFLQYITELGKTSDLFKEDIDVVAQAATFFADGYLTSSRVMSFVVFEISRHPEIQQKLRNEINEVCKKYNNCLTYEGIQEMPYLNACFYESMRLYPIIGQMLKLCTEEFTYTPTDPTYKKISVTVKPGTSLILPIGSYGNDKKYIENPDKYIPERMLDRESLNRYAYMPFGEGPRSCLGMRFATTQIKLGLAQLVRNFEITMNKKTKLPLKYDLWYFLPSPIGGLWVDFKKIKE